jgi:hypothetical protein
METYHTSLQTLTQPQPQQQPPSVVVTSPSLPQFRKLLIIKRKSRDNVSPSSENYIRTLSGSSQPFKLGLTKINDLFYIGSVEEARNQEVLPLSLKSFCYMMQSLPSCLTYLENAIDNNHRIAILCRDGFTKALNLVIAFYIVKYGANYEDIRTQLNDIVPQVIPYMNTEYENHLQKMATMISFGSTQDMQSHDNKKRISRPPSHSYRLYNLR